MPAQKWPFASHERFEDIRQRRATAPPCYRANSGGNTFARNQPPSVAAGRPATILPPPPIIAGQPSAISCRPATIPRRPAIVEGQPSTLGGRPPTIEARPPTIEGQPPTIERRKSTIKGRKSALISVILSKKPDFSPIFDQSTATIN